MKNLSRTLPAIVALVVILGIWECAGSPFFGLGVRTPFESAATYHMRMMYYHGRETKDGRDALHGDQLVALGEKAVPVLVDAVGYGFNPRFDPKPHEMLARFPSAAHVELSRTIKSLKESPKSPPAYKRSHFLNRRVNLTTALILVSNDWTFLDLWLSDIREMGGSSYGVPDDVIPLMDRMLKAILENKSAPEPFIGTELRGSIAINPAFVTWWKDNGSRIAAKESQEGFRNAKGWKSGWYRDRDQLRDK
jgi:hypothetical protein